MVVYDCIIMNQHKEITQYNFIKKLTELVYIDEIWLFGSRARGDNKERADIDLAIVCPNATDLDWLKVTNIINNADTLMKIDFIRLDKEKINKELYQNILKEKKIIYAKK